MSENKSARDNENGAPLLPGGDPEQAGTGPEGAIFATDGSVTPLDEPDEHPREDDGSLGAESQAANKGEGDKS